MEVVGGERGIAVGTVPQARLGTEALGHMSGHQRVSATHQGAQDGQEDGDGGWIADKLCDDGHQDTCQESDSPRWEAAQRQHLMPDPRGEAGALQEEVGR